MRKTSLASFLIIASTVAAYADGMDAHVLPPPRPNDLGLNRVTIPLPPPRPSDLTPPSRDMSALAEFERKALEAGISRDSIDRVLRTHSPDTSLERLTTSQSEFVKPIWDYLDDATSGARILRGRAMLLRYGHIIADIEQRYGVPREIILGIWGMETSFGSFLGNHDVMRSVLTLAEITPRKDFFLDQAIALMRIQEAQPSLSGLRGSWAGAFGQTQFMPTSFLSFAVDGDGDGEKDLVGSVEDALASSANYLVAHGWNASLPWGVEVSLPPDFDYSIETAPVSDWVEKGLSPLSGSWGMSGSALATLFLPAGSNGPAFLTTENFRVIKRYNASDAYALGVVSVGQLTIGDRAIVAPWPRDMRVLTRSEAKELQSKLSRLSLYEGRIDGIIGSKSRAGVRELQRKLGLDPDGFPTRDLLEFARDRLYTLNLQGG